MVDFHSHVLFDVDDGSESLEMSMKMIEQSISEGVKILALTPHHIKGLFETAMEEKEVYEEKFEFLRRKYNGRIELIKSVELMINEDLLEELQSGKTFGYGGTKTVLVEFNLLEVPTYAEGLFYKMRKEGYQVILAHPERNKALREDPDLLYHLHDLGVLFQLNAGSLLGQFGEKVEKFSKELMNVNLIHVLGSDGHKDKVRDMRIRHAYEELRRLNPEAYEWTMEHSEKLMRGEQVETLAYKPWTEGVKVRKKKKKKKSLFSILGF